MGGRRVGGINWKIGIDIYTLLCVKQITSKNLLCTPQIWLNGKESVCKTGDMEGAAGLIPGLGRPPWGRKWRPTPVCLPEKCHGQKSLAGYSPWGRKESDTTQQLNSNSKDLPYSTGNSMQYLLITYKGKEFEYIYIYII